MTWCYFDEENSFGKPYESVDAELVGEGIEFKKEMRRPLPHVMLAKLAHVANCRIAEGKLLHETLMRFPFLSY